MEEYGAEVRDLQQQVEQEIAQLQTTQQQTIASLQTEHDDEVKDIRERLQRVSQLVHVIAPAFTSLKQEHVALRQLCRAVPDMYAHAFGDTSKQVGSPEYHY